MHLTGLISSAYSRSVLSQGYAYTFRDSIICLWQLQPVLDHEPDNFSSARIANYIFYQFSESWLSNSCSWVSQGWWGPDFSTFSWGSHIHRFIEILCKYKSNRCQQFPPLLRISRWISRWKFRWISGWNSIRNPDGYRWIPPGNWWIFGLISIPSLEAGFCRRKSRTICSLNSGVFSWISIRFMSNERKQRRFQKWIDR